MSHSPQVGGRLSNILPRNHGGPTTSIGSATESTSSRRPSISSQRDSRIRNTTALPSLATLAGENDSPKDQSKTGSPNPWRSLGVRNILNPASDTQVQQTQPTPRSPPTSAPQEYRGPLAAPATSPHVRKRGQPHSPVIDSHMQQSERSDRRVLTPRSPSLRAVRTASVGGYRSPSAGGGHIQRIPLPSGEGRGYTIEPGDSRDAAIPPLPPLSAATRGSLTGMQHSDPRSPAVHGTGTNMSHQAPIPPHKRQEQRSDYNRPPFSNSEAGPPAFMQNQGQMHVPSTVSGGEDHGNYAPHPSGPVRSGLPYGQAEYQLTFETQQGPMVVPVNVDYQQASRLADEKRKRNAGASARFRQRRKEKEREANQTIAGLQQEMQDLVQEREFYLRERNFFRDMVARTNPGPLPVRPHSPQARRTYTGTSTASETSPRLEYAHHDVELQASQRRQTGEYQTSLASQSPPSTYASSFPPPPLSAQSMNLPALPGPNMYSESRPGPGPGPSPSTTRAPLFDPLRRNILDRDWNMGR